MLVENRKLGHNYLVVETFEAGVELTGGEVKSAKLGRASIGDSYARIKDGQLYLVNAYFAPYMGSADNPTRERRLLLKKSQIHRLSGQVQSGLTLVPKKVYNKGPWIKVEVALARGKKTFEKRADLRKRAIERDIQEALRGDKLKHQSETRR